jgi:hypothetical protein
MSPERCRTGRASRGLFGLALAASMLAVMVMGGCYESFSYTAGYGYGGYHGCGPDVVIGYRAGPSWPGGWGSGGGWHGGHGRGW